MTRRSWLRNVIAPRTPRTIRKAPARHWLVLEALEDRCLLSGDVYLPDNTSGIDKLSQVVYNGVTGTDQKTITITNNSDQTIYPMLQAPNDKHPTSGYVGTSPTDPYDPTAQGYRGYIGYTDGTHNIAGLPPHTSITITNVPLAFWDSGRINFTTDGADQFNTTNKGVSFFFSQQNTSAKYFFHTENGDLTKLYFTKAYNSFGGDGMPSTADWKSPVTTGALLPGTYTITGGLNLPADATITVDAANPDYVTLNDGQVLTGPVNKDDFGSLFTLSAKTAAPSPTDHFIQMNYTLTNIKDPNNPVSTSNGEVMWYHALDGLNPSPGAPFQLTEVTFRGTLYNTPGYQALWGGAWDGAKTNSVDYDVSYVDAVNMAVAMEAPNATTPVLSSQAPFGWGGSDKSLTVFQDTVKNFTTANTNGNNVNGLGWYFGDNGYPIYPSIAGQENNIKLPSGYNLFTGPEPLPGTAYASSAIEKLWYSWAKYYVENIGQLSPAPPVGEVPGKISDGNILTLDNPKLAQGLLPGMVVTSPQDPNVKVFVLYIGQNGEVHLSETVSGSLTKFQFANPDLSSILGYKPELAPYQFVFDEQNQAKALAFAQTVYTVMASWSHTPETNPANPSPPDRLLLSQIIGGNFGPHYPNNNTDIVVTLTNMSKSALRSVPDYTSPLYSNPALWYPDPALKTPGLVSGIDMSKPFNVYNLDPIVWFIHEKLGSTSYAFALDDDVGNVNAPGATEVDASVGGLTGLQNQTPFTNASPWGVLTSPQTIATTKSSGIKGSDTPEQKPFTTVVDKLVQFDYNANIPGTLVNGPGVQMGTTVQITSPNKDTPSLTSITLSNPLGTITDLTPQFTFFGALTFTGTVLGDGQPTDTIYLDTPDAYNTLLQLRPFDHIQVHGEGIDPTKTVTFNLSQVNGKYVVTLLTPDGNPFNLDKSLVSQAGGSYAYTFGSPVSSLVHDPGFEFNLDVPNVTGKYLPGKVLTPDIKTALNWFYQDAVDGQTQQDSRYAGIAFDGGGEDKNSFYTNNNDPAPQGLDVGFIQGQSYIISAPKSLVTLRPGTYTLSFYAAQSYPFNSMGQKQTLDVQLVSGSDLTQKGISIGTISPVGTTFQHPSFTFTVGLGDSDTVTPGKYAIKFLGTTTDAGTALIDNIALSQSSTPTSPPPTSPPPPTPGPLSNTLGNQGGGGFTNFPSLVQEVVTLAQDELLMTIDQFLWLVDVALGLVPDPALLASIAADQNAINANPLAQTLLGQEIIDSTFMETLKLL
jgi:hypothetical protein